MIIIAVINTFKRTEKKYILTSGIYERFRSAISPQMQEDQYGWDTICSVYYDTPHFDLIRRSIDKPVYKEKLRIRSYGVPAPDTNVYIELKKKYDGIVYKRRVSLPYRIAMDFLDNRTLPEVSGLKDRQIINELSYCMEHYSLRPAMFIAYDRVALFCPEKPTLRITFDRNIRFRTTDLELIRGSDGQVILPEDMYLMEIKENGAMPLWLTHTLTELSVKPGSFSKYGTAYKLISGAATNQL